MDSQSDSKDREFVDGNVRKFVGIAALKRIRKIVAEYQQSQKLERPALIIITVGMCMVLAFTLLLGDYRPKPSKPPAAATLQYANAWKQAVEARASTNPPAYLKAMQLTGTVVLSTSIKADGRIEKTVVETSSGQEALDRAAVDIVRSAGPFAPFSDEIKRDTDIISITNALRFYNGELRPSK